MLFGVPTFQITFVSRLFGIAMNTGQMAGPPSLLLSCFVAVSYVGLLPCVWSWTICDVTSRPFGAVGDGLSKDTTPIRQALSECDEVVLPEFKTFLTGPLNLTTNQVLTVDGTLLASTDKRDYPLVPPLIGYGWGEDKNCFPRDEGVHKIIVGSLRYAPVIDWGLPCQQRDGNWVWGY